MSASAVNAIVNSAAYANGRRVADVRIDEIGTTLCQPDRFVWIGLHEPDEALLKQVQKEFGLHHLAIEMATLSRGSRSSRSVCCSTFASSAPAGSERQDWTPLTRGKGLVSRESRR